MKSDLPIGVFDSGMGGLTAVRALRELLPGEDIVYFGDTGRVPYGTRSESTIKEYARQDIELLNSFNCKFIIAACGTVSSVASDVLSGLDIPNTGVVVPAAQAAVEKTSNGKIGVIGTSATVDSGAFERVIGELDSSVRVFSKSCPVFVPLVENGWSGADDEIAILAAHRYLEDIKSAGVDTLILGCTHFPLLREVISSVMGDGVELINTGKQAALAAQRMLKEADLLNTSCEQGNCRFYVSDDVKHFSELANMFLGTDIKKDVELVKI